MIRSKKITQSAKDEDCTMGSPVCNGNPATVCWRHSNYGDDGKGWGIKAHDILGFYGCQPCEYWFSHQASKEDKLFYFFRAWKRSIIRLFEKGVIVIK